MVDMRSGGCWTRGLLVDIAALECLHRLLIVSCLTIFQGRSPVSPIPPSANVTRPFIIVESDKFALCTSLGDLNLVRASRRIYTILIYLLIMVA